jgi:isoleucyl-tRNA synthetase
MREIAAAFSKLGQHEIAEIERCESYKMSLPSGEVVLSADDYEISSEDMPGWLIATEGRLTVALDITITEELRREGIARELINRIQNFRKESGLEVTDRIIVEIGRRSDVEEALADNSEYVCSQTLASKIELRDNIEGASAIDWENDEKILLKISRL